MFPLICARTNGWANNQDVGDLKRHCAHYCVTKMWTQLVIHPHWKTCSFYDFGPILKISHPEKSVNIPWFWPGDAIVCHRTWSALVQVMASCLMALNHYLKQYWLTMNMILWFSFHDNVYLSTQYYTNTSFMKYTRLKFVKGSHYISGTQYTKLGFGCMSADALVCDAARAPVDVMLPKCILQILSFHWCRFLSYSCTVCMSRNVRKFSVPCVTSVTWTNLSLYLITWRINRQHDDLTVPANAWGSIYVGLSTKLSFQRIHLKRSVARSPPCCVLSHRYRYRSFNQNCSGLLHLQLGKHIVGQTIARAIQLTRTYFLWSPQREKITNTHVSENSRQNLGTSLIYAAIETKRFNFITSINLQ